MASSTSSSTEPSAVSEAGPVGLRSDRFADERIAFVRGEGAYLGDIVARSDGVLHAAFVRSQVAHARVAEIDLGDARTMPGVAAVFTSRDLGDLVIPAQLRPNMVAIDGMDRPVLADQVVRYVGEPIVMVVADSAARALDAADLIFVEYDELEPVVDPAEAVAGRSLLFPATGTNIVGTPSVGSDSIEEGPVSVTIEVTNQRLAAVSLEALGILASPTATGIDISCGHQMTHRLRADLASVVGLDESSLTVHVPDTGGAFGLKGAMYPEYAAVTKASTLLGRPVAWLERRREHLSGGTHGRDQRHRVTLTGDAGGRFMSVDVEVVADLGAYPSAGSFIAATTLACAQGPYDIPGVRARATMVVTNKAPVGPYRGAGRPEATYALELAVDEFARAVGMDPIDVRRRNLIRPDQLPYRAGTGAVYDGGDYPAALDALEELLQPRTARAASADGLRRGVGACIFVEPAGGAPQSGEYARVSISADGSITVWSGAVASGQGHSRVFRRIVADVLGVAPDGVEVVVGQTDGIPRSVGSFGSRSIQVGAAAVIRTAREVDRIARQTAAGRLEVSVDDLVPTGRGYAVAGVPGSEIGFGEIARELTAAGSSLDVDEWYQPGRQTFPYGAYGAVVAVDTETGEVRVERVVAVDDCGAVIDPAGAHEQVIGGIAQGLGQALSEWIEYDDRGQLLTGSLTDYRIPTAQEMPQVGLGSVLTVSDVNDLGARGVGEAGTIGAPPAIALALADALGGPPPPMPFRPQTIWRVLERSQTDG